MSVPRSSSSAAPAPWVALVEPPVSSAGSGAVRLAAFRQPPQRVPEHVASTYILCINTGRTTRFEQCVNGIASGGPSRYGDMTLYPPGAVQRFAWRDPADFLHVYIDPDTVGALGTELFGEPTPLRGPSVLDGDSLLLELAVSLLRTGSAPDPSSSVRFARLASALATHLVHRHLDGERTGPGAANGERASGTLRDGQLERVIGHIERHLHEPLTVDALAGLVHLSPSHFSRSFRAATGLAPHRYVVARRVIRAAALLRTSSLPIARVADATGFSNQNHLNRHFRRQLGTSPGAYRRSRSVRALER